MLYRLAGGRDQWMPWQNSPRAKESTVTHITSPKGKNGLANRRIFGRISKFA